MAKLKKIKSKSEGNVGRKGSVMDTFCAWNGDILVLNILGTPSHAGYASRTFLGLG